AEGFCFQTLQEGSAVISFSVIRFTLIPCQQVQTLARQLAELSRLVQTLFCLSLGSCEKTVCLHLA
ncbi:MAG: hypothetical protein ACI3YD_04195, partial [Alloprevotella sp.]